MAYIKKHILIVAGLIILPAIILLLFTAAVMSVFAAGAAADSGESLEGVMGEGLPEGLTYSVVEYCVQAADIAFRRLMIMGFRPRF